MTGQWVGLIAQSSQALDDFVEQGMDSYQITSIRTGERFSLLAFESAQESWKISQDTPVTRYKWFS